MHFLRDSGVSSVLESSCIPYTLRFSATAPCVALSPASLQACARRFLALAQKSLFLEMPICRIQPLRAGALDRRAVMIGFVLLHWFMGAEIQWMFYSEWVGVYL